MIRLFLSEPNWKDGGSGDTAVSARRWISLLNQLESVIWSFMTASGRSEARLWLCKTISSITSVTPRQQRDVFVNLLRTKPTNRGLACQLLQMIFEKIPQKVGPIVAKRSYILEKFFEGNPVRIMQWFSNFDDGGGLQHKKGARALSQFAFMNRDLCWEELEWKGKHGQSPAVVATKPHYFLDLNVQRTVENFLENVPEFWSSSEFAETLRDGDILFIDTKYFIEFFVGLMYKEDARDVWEVLSEFLMQESFSSLCNHLLITFEEEELFTFLKSFRRYLSPRMESMAFCDSSCWLELVLSKFSECESIDQLLLLSAVINQGRQLLRLVRDDEESEEQSKIKEIVSQVCTISGSLAPLLNECMKMKKTESIKFLGLQSWVLHYALSVGSQSSESWECLLSNNGIGFRKSDKYELLHYDGLLKENESELNNDASMKRKRRKEKKSRKKIRRKLDDDDVYDNELLDFDASNNQQDLKAGAGSWLLSTDGFSASWTSVDLPEHLSKFCFSTWLKWLFAK